MSLPQNISKRERIVRGVIGGLLIVSTILGGFGKLLVFLIGVALIAFAALNYCGIVDMIERFKLDGGSNTPPPPSNPTT